MDAKVMKKMINKNKYIYIKKIITGPHKQRTRRKPTT